MNISIFGTGYVGIVAAACFAELGHIVWCYDIDEKKIEPLKSGVSPLYEPGLNDLLKKNLENGRLHFTDDEKKVVEEGEFIFIAVGTPEKEDGSVEMKYVYTVAETIGKYVNENKKIIVDKSTVPVGTAKKVREKITSELTTRGKNFEFAVVSNPEFLREGTAISDFMEPDRIVIGANEKWAREKMEELYACFSEKEYDVYFTDVASAEIAKYASNAFLAAKIAFINEISAICEKTGGDVEEVRKMMVKDKRIATGSLYPGLGYGGGCFPKDIKGLSGTIRELGIDAKLIMSIENSNKAQVERFIQKIKKELQEIKEKKIGIWGLSFKANTDDMRGAQSIEIINFLLKEGAEISAYDPVAIEEARKILWNKILYEEDMYICVKDADALIIPTEWDIFKNADIKEVKNLMKTPLVFDGRNIWNPEKAKEEGIRYISVGR